MSLRSMFAVAAVILVLLLASCTGSVQSALSPSSPAPSLMDIPSPSLVEPAPAPTPAPSPSPSPLDASPTPGVDKGLPTGTKIVPTLSPPPPSPSVEVKDVTSAVIKDLVAGVNDARAEAGTSALGTLSSLITASKKHAIAMAAQQRVFSVAHGDREGAARGLNSISPRQLAYRLAKSSGIARDASLYKMGAGLCYSNDGYGYICITANHMLIVVSPH